MGALRTAYGVGVEVVAVDVEVDHVEGEDLDQAEDGFAEETGIR